MAFKEPQQRRYAQVPVTGAHSPNFDEQAQAIARMRATVAAMQQQEGLKPEMVGNQYIAPGWLGAFEKLARGGMQGMNTAMLNKQDDDLAQRRSAAAEDFFKNYAADKTVEPQGPMEDGSAMLPVQTPKTPQELLLASARGMNQGIAGAKELFGANLQELADSRKPQKPGERFKVVGNDLYDNVEGKFIASPGTEAARASVIQAREQAQLDRKAELERRIASDANTLEDRKQAREQHASLMREMAAGRAATAGSGGSMSSAGTTPEGAAVVRNSKTGELHVAGADGRMLPQPYAGQVILPGQEKDVQKAISSTIEAKQLDALADRVADPANAKVFGVQANLGSIASAAMGGLAKDALTGLKPEQRELRSVVGRDFAKATKELYGANFTQSEQERANTFTPQKNDTPGEIAMKIRSAAQFSREMAEKYGTKIGAAVAARTGAAPAAPAAGGWGKVTVTP
jgi:hypothetical protein